MSIDNPVLNLWRERNQPLHRNGFYLMLSSITGSAFGFFFWMIVARNYSVNDTGLATALVSAMMLLAILSRFGFDYALIRFLPNASNKRAMLNTCLTISGIVALGVAGIFLLGLNVWSPKLLFARQDWNYIMAFVLFTAVQIINQLQSQSFIGLRSAKYSLLATVINGVRLPIVILLTGFGVLGIYSSIGLASVVVMIVGVFFTMRLMDYKPVPVIRKDIATNLFKFSMGNYAASNLAMLPSYLMPLMIVSILNPEASAYFYIGFSVSGILGMVAGSMAFSLIAESQYEPDLLRHNVIKSARTSLLITGVGIGVVFAIGRIILGWFNPVYVDNATHILWVSSLIWLPAIPNTLYLAVARVRINIKAIVGVDGALAGLIIGLAYVLLPRFGAVGASYAFLAGHGLVACFTAPKLLSDLGISVKNLIRGDGLVAEQT